MYVWMAHSELGRQDWEDAVIAGKLATITDPTYPEGYETLGYAYLKWRGHAKGRRDTDRRTAEVQRFLEEASRRFPDDPLLQAYLGELLIDLRQWTRAVAAYRRALDLKPDEPGNMMGLAEALYELDGLDEAADLLERAHRLTPDNPHVLFWLGCVRLKQEDAAGAIAPLLEATRLAPEMVSAHYYLAWAFAGTARWQDALAEARRGLELDPQDAALQELEPVIEHNLQRAEEQ